MVSSGNIIGMMTSKISIESYCFKPSVINKLEAAQLHYVNDILALTKEELRQVTNLDVVDCEDVISTLSAPPVNHSFTLLQLIENDSASSIVTFSSTLDELLEGGIHTSCLTEICGTPATGKTQLCLQLCVSVQVPKAAYGVEGRAVFIDTEGCFVLSRIQEIATDAVKHVHSLHTGQDLKDFSVSSILSGITYIRCLNYNEMMSTLNNLGAIIESQGNISLIVIDSLTFYFRHDCPDSITRSSVLCTLANNLKHLATMYNIAIVVTNQMTKKFNEDGSSEEVAYLGDVWGHNPSHRLLLSWHNQDRVATNIKHPNATKSSVKFQITKSGIRDVPSSTSNISNNRKRRRSSSSNNSTEKL